ncbi:unnamed protein product [Rangifer tarandus platyrhynchus]|uniref:Uncharacterized protein n=1 Tax=Rangifer tarandus platyrhynchus TaxID=3082113 RepID=A0ABN8XXP0_RANTA|nr:unnamed protein product [Rangifer tarandus platyrhynchus]
MLGAGAEETLCCGRASSSAVSSFTLAAAVPPWLLFLRVSGTDFLPPLARLLCCRLPASLSATFLPPFSSLPAARPAPSPLLLPRAPRPLRAPRPPPASPPPARRRLRGCPAPRERLAPGAGAPARRRTLPAAARALEPGKGQVQGTRAGAEVGELAEGPRPSGAA